MITIKIISKTTIIKTKIIRYKKHNMNNKLMMKRNSKNANNLICAKLKK